MSPIIAKPWELVKSLVLPDLPHVRHDGVGTVRRPGGPLAVAHRRGRRLPGDPGRDQPVGPVRPDERDPARRPRGSAGSGCRCWPCACTSCSGWAGGCIASSAWTSSRSGANSPTSIAPGTRRSRRWGSPISRSIKRRCSWCWAGRRSRRMTSSAPPRSRDRSARCRPPPTPRCTSRPTATGSG